jgi:hypothetical protein
MKIQNLIIHTKIRVQEYITKLGHVKICCLKKKKKHPYEQGKNPPLKLCAQCV